MVEGDRRHDTSISRHHCNNSTNGIFITHSSLFQLQFDKIKIRRAAVGGRNATLYFIYIDDFMLASGSFVEQTC